MTVCSAAVSPRSRLVSLPLWVYRHRLAILASLGALLLAVVVVAGHFISRVSSRFDGRRWSLPSRIYSDIYVLLPGETGSVEALAAKLSRLYYREDDAAPERPGRFRRFKDAIEVHTRPFRYPGRYFPSVRVRVAFEKGKARTLLDGSGQTVPALILEPERLGSVFSAELEDRTVIRLSEAPQSLIDAVLVTEDRDFYRHSGVSVRRAYGALVATMRGGMKQGESTLTQQLVKTLNL